VRAPTAFHALPCGESPTQVLSAGHPPNLLVRVQVGREQSTNRPSVRRIAMVAEDKRYKVTVSVRIPVDLLERLDRAATRQGMNRSELIVLALRKYLAELGEAGELKEAPALP